MKHSILRKLMLIAVLLTSSHAFAYDFKVDGLEYNILPSNTCEIVNSAYMSTINIPSGVVGGFGNFYTVVGIADNAFSNNHGLESVTIPKTITQIGRMAFYACSKLKSIVIDKENTFYDSRDNCNAIIETATNTLKKGCTNTIIPESVTSIGDYSFYNCRELISISIPNSITSIGDCAFASCVKLNSVTIPNSVTNIAINAFTNCYSVNSIIVESENTIYDSRDNCNAIIETATNSLIVGCKNTIIPSSVTSIGDFSFYECSDLTSIKIPNSVTSIGTVAFYRCSGLTSVTIPNSVTSIGEFAFGDCSGLTSITIPNSVTSIGDYAFAYCSGLTNVTCESKTPPTATSMTFRSVPTTATLYVPIGSKEAYANATGWKNFTNIIEDDVKTGVESTLAGNVNVSIENGNIVVTGADNTKIEVYSVNGQCVYSGNATTIPVTAKGLYIVKVGNKSYKVML